jgi:hypothetical protein
MRRLIRLATEVERARKLIEETCVGYKIAKVDTFQDKIVFTGGITHEDYVRHLELGLTGVGADDLSIGQRTGRKDDHGMHQEGQDVSAKSVVILNHSDDGD